MCCTRRKEKVVPLTSKFVSKYKVHVQLFRRIKRLPVPFRTFLPITADYLRLKYFYLSKQEDIRVLFLAINLSIRLKINVMSVFCCLLPCGSKFSIEVNFLEIPLAAMNWTRSD